MTARPWPLRQIPYRAGPAEFELRAHPDESGASYRHHILSISVKSLSEQGVLAPLLDWFRHHELFICKLPMQAAHWR